MHTSYHIVLLRYRTLTACVLHRTYYCSARPALLLRVSALPAIVVMDLTFRKIGNEVPLAYCDVSDERRPEAYWMTREVSICGVLTIVSCSP